LTLIATNGVILLALFILTLNLLMPFLNGKIENSTMSSTIGLIISLALASPFLWGLMIKRPNQMAYKEMWLDRKYNRGPLLVMEIARISIGMLLISFWVFRLFETKLALVIAVPIIAVVLFFLTKR